MNHCCNPTRQLLPLSEKLLKKLVQLDSRACAKVALKAREILIQCSLPSIRKDPINWNIF